MKNFLPGCKRCYTYAQHTPTTSYLYNWLTLYQIANFNMRLEKVIVCPYANIASACRTIILPHRWHSLNWLVGTSLHSVRFAARSWHALIFRIPTTRDSVIPAGIVLAIASIIEGAFCLLARVLVHTEIIRRRDYRPVKKR